MSTPVGCAVKTREGNGRVVRWEPLSSGMCDTLVALDSGQEVWFASREVMYADGCPLPDRSSEVTRARDSALAQLRAIREQHVKDFNRPWPGCEHGKTTIGRAIDGAIRNIESKSENKPD